MKNKLKFGLRDTLLFFIGVVLLIVGIIYYSNFPEQVAIHFNLFNGEIRFNYFIGIRTPWTIANEEVWRHTHRFTGPILIFSGILITDLQLHQNGYVVEFHSFQSPFSKLISEFHIIFKIQKNEAGTKPNL